MQRSKIKDNGLVPRKAFYKNEKFKVSILSIPASISVLVLSFLLSEFSQTNSIRDMGIIFGILVGVIPFTVLQLKEVQRKDSIDKNLPVFLMSLLSSVQSGANLIRAIEQAAEHNMGALTPELKNLRANISWGMPIEETFENFAQRTGTRLARRITVLLEMAYRIGGDISSNLEMIQKHVTEMQNIEKNRKSSLQPYTYTIYISFIVFIAVAVLLTTNFFTQIEDVQRQLVGESESDTGIFSSLKGIDIGQLQSLLFNMALIEAVFGGLAAGKIGSGSYISGIKHTVIMIVIAIVAFNIIQI